MFYDTFALRDAEGHEMLMQTWPYFRSRESRRAMLSNVAVPVSSCWNGMGKLVLATEVLMHLLTLFCPLFVVHGNNC
jgi:hypothetical protein